MVTKLQAKAAYVRWLQAKHPALYQAALQSESGLSGITDTINKVVDWVSDQGVKLGTAYVQGKAALDLIKLNTARAKAGLLPVNSLEQAQEEARQSPPGMMGNIPPWVLYAGLGLIAFMILRR